MGLFNMALFGSLQRSMQAKASPSEKGKHPDVNFIQSAATLLAPEKRQQLLRNIKALLNLPPKLYDNLYNQIIEQFAEFVQELPENQHGIFAQEGGFLDHGLDRASRALSLCLAYFFPQEKTFHNVSAQQALWVYAVFTAALLLDVGKIAVKYNVSICQKDGKEIKKWIPHTCSMVAQGKFYKFEYEKENRDVLRRLVTPLLARQILDDATSNVDKSNQSAGFNLIASDPVVLEAWLSMLGTEKKIPMTSFMTVIPLADMQTIENYLKALKTPGAGTGIFGGLPATVEETLLGDVTAGDAFLNWLRDGLAKGTISINQADSNVHVTQEGILLFADVFEDFANTNPVNKNPEVAAKQFKAIAELYNVSIAELGQRYSLIKGISAREKLKGMIMQNATHLLYLHGGQLPISTNVAVAPIENKAAQPPVSPINPKQTNPNATLQHR